jgi:hypothetical protein
VELGTVAQAPSASAIQVSARKLLVVLIITMPSIGHCKRSLQNLTNTPRLSVSAFETASNRCGRRLPKQSLLKALSSMFKRITATLALRRRRE